MFVNINEKIIALSFFHSNSIRLIDDIGWSILKDIYVEEYKSYIEHGDYPPPPTGGGIVWELVFKNDVFIKKKVYETQ